MSDVPSLSTIAELHDPYFVQRVKVDSQFAAMPKGQFFSQFLAGKSARLAHWVRRLADYRRQRQPPRHVGPNLCAIRRRRSTRRGG